MFTAEFAESAENNKNVFFETLADLSAPGGEQLASACSLTPVRRIQYARLKEIRWGSSRPVKDFTV
jgi:hypothetical protein